ncbi:Bicupin, oxalate decarboxylase/oxidase [Patellaria atrata CBS 101060]|uniref:Bicupin, oxalate decarboxylase/oxidase n=1 Tax=Patellaria atrata CBS 101060 TaxID=1346257 RepID=A0A9P4SBN7_9PEZI|nr:Bicupin, oxalate decarboxylase/oxidase [Patellaria atrata CBS 101060]
MLLKIFALGVIVSSTFVHGAPTRTSPERRQDGDNPPFRGSTALVGYNPTNTLTNEDTDDIEFEFAPGQTADANIGQYLNFEDIENPQPIRGSRGGTDPGPQTPEYSRLNPDKLAPPGTDHGQTINAQWPMGLSHVKAGIDRAGWSRQENTQVMPDAKAMAGVDMRLEPGAYRELHWHVAGEWALMLNGTVRIAAINEEGESFIDDVSKGDVWFFPPGVPHSIQALDGGAEFMLVFDDGDFSEDNTFLITEIMAHHPREVLAKDLSVDISAFQDIPAGELFIFPGTPAPHNISEQNVTSSTGPITPRDSYSFHWSEQPAHRVEGGSIKIVDPVTFPIASNFAAALVTVHPGAMREIHWHPASDEWTFFLSGKGRATLFTPPRTATTFDYLPGDVGYFPQSNSHYIENVGDEDLVFLEVLQADRFSDISLGQWLGLTPPQVVIDTLNLSPETVSKFPKEKPFIVQG